MRKHLSESTWTLIQDKKNKRRRLSDLQKASDWNLLKLCFGAWLHGDSQHLGNTLNESADLDRQIALALHSFRQLGRLVTAALRQDDKEFFNNLAEETGQMDTPGQSKQLWDRIRWSLPKTRAKAQRSPLLMDSLDEQWVPHFSKLEADLVNRCAERQAVPEVVHTSLQDLPTRLEVEQALRALKPNRAPGPDGLPSDLFRGAAAVLAPALHDLYAKLTFWATEPIQFKGGHMHPIYKKGDEELAANYRGIMLLNVASKVYHSLLRKKLIEEIAAVKVDTQIGGFGGQQATFGSHCIQTIAKMAHQHQKPMACLFVDIQGAYHFLVRELVFGHVDASDEQRVVDNLLAWDADVSGLNLWLRLPGILQRARFPRKLIQILKEIHCDTWARLPHLSTFIRTSRGSRPGSPLADAVYAALMMDIHIEIYRLMTDCEAIKTGFGLLGLDCLAVTWADDLAVPFVVETNDLLVPTVAELTAKIYRAFENRGLLLNMSKGKTAAVLAFRGASAPRFRAQYLLCSHPGTYITLPGQRQIWMHFSCSYRRLGAVFVPDGEAKCEVLGRLGQASTAFQSMRRALFGNRHISVRTRLGLFESLVASRLCYGICTWGHVPAKTFQRVENFIARSQRYICGYPLEHGPSNDYMISTYRLPSLQQRMSMARISYAIRVWSVGPETLQNLLIAEQDAIEASWWGHLMEDIRWCTNILGDRFPTADTEMTTLTSSWRREPSKWIKAIRKAFKAAVLQESTAADVRDWHHQIVKTLQGHGATFDGLDIDHGSKECDALQCNDCGRSFSTIQGLTSHRRFAHNYEAPENKLVGKLTSCPHCLRYLWTPSRVKQHLAYMPRNGKPNECYSNLLRSGFVAPADADIPAPVDLGHTYGINRRDALRHQGPLPHLPDALGDQIKQAEIEVRLLEDDYNRRFGEMNVNLQDVEMQSRALTTATTEWFNLGPSHPDGTFDFYTLQTFWLEATPVHDGLAVDACSTIVLGWGRYVLPDVWATWDSGEAEAVAETAFYDLIKPSDIFIAGQDVELAQGRLRALLIEKEKEKHLKPHRPVKYGPLYHRGGNKNIKPICQRYLDDDGWHRKWTQCRLVNGFKDIKMPFFQQVANRKVYLVLHLFSGRRRETDLHYFLETMAEKADFDIKILSLDTAVDPEYGNLSKGGTTWKHVVDLLRGGHIAAGVAGSPCETFSAARYNPPPEDLPDHLRKRWPRPLRDAAHPWGLNGIYIKELTTGSQLALQTVFAIAWVLATGGSFISEHPAPPADPTKVSIFNTPVLKLLREFPEVGLAVINQGDYGACATKPTGLLHVRLPRLKASMWKWRQPTPYAQREVAIGADSTGKFRTSKLKEYPCAFSRGLAQAVFDSIARRHLGDTRFSHFEAADTWFDTAVRLSNTVRDDAEMLPDFQGG